MIKFMGATDTGKVRQQNQDAFICRRVGENTGYAIVCDGMGGEKAGEVASATACQLIDKFFHRDVNEEMSESAAKAVIFSAISAANAKVYSMAKENPDYHGYGHDAGAGCGSRRKYAHRQHRGQPHLYGGEKGSQTADKRPYSGSESSGPEVRSVSRKRSTTRRSTTSPVRSVWEIRWILIIRCMS